MITPFTIYLITVLSEIKYFFSIILIVSFILMVAFIVSYLMVTALMATVEKELNKELNDAPFFLVIKKGLKIIIPTVVLSSLIGIFVPNIETTIAMYGIPAAINTVKSNKEAVQIPKNLMRFINQWLIKNTKEEKD